MIPDMIFWVVWRFLQRPSRELLHKKVLCNPHAAWVINWATKRERFHHVTGHLRSRAIETLQISLPPAILIKLLKLYRCTWILKLLFCVKLPHVPSLRLGMLWESLWRKPLCTTGMTWICRTWWITSRKRCCGQFHLARAAVFVSVAIHITQVFKLITASGLLNMSEH